MIRIATSGSGVWQWLAPVTLLAALLAIAMIYWQGLQGPFLFDDEYNIPPAKVADFNWNEIRNVMLANESGPLRRPISVLTFTLNHHLAGSGPFGFKYVNLMLHLLNALLMFWLGGRLLLALGGEERRAHVWIVSGAAALLWAVHPIQLTAVLYAVQRMAMLAGTFSLAAALCYVIARQRLACGSDRVFPLAILIALFSILALLSKESGALIVFFIAVIEFAAFRLRAANDQARRKVFALLGVFSLIPIASGLAYFATHLDTLLVGYAARDFGLADRLITQPGVLWWYVKLILWPDITAMSLFHDDYPVAQLGVLSLLQILSIPAAVAAAVALRNRWPVVTFGILWFLAAHLMESTVFPLELVFEHRNYLAAYGLLLPVCFFLIPATWHSLRSQLRLLCYAGVVAVFSFQTHTRAQTWSNAGLLASVTVQEHPNSARAQNAYGAVLRSVGQHALALEATRRAERLDARNTGYTTGVLLGECALGSVSAATLERLRDKLESHPLNTQTVTNFNHLLAAMVQKRCDGLDARAVLDFTASAARYADTEPQPSKRAAGYLYYAIALSQFGDKRAQAIDFFRKAYEAEPSNIGPLVAMGQLQASAGRLAEARQTLERARLQNTRHITDRSHLLARLEQRLERLESTR